MPAPAQSFSPRTRGPRIDNLTILVVDDEPGVRILMGAALERAGYAVLKASDGNEALELAECHERPIHLMIADMGLPDVDGRHLAARFSRLRPETKIMLMSGSATGGLMANELFLEKPFALNELVGRVRALIRT